MSRKNVDIITIHLDAKGGEDDISLSSFAKLLSETANSLRELDPAKTLSWKIQDATRNSPLTVVTTADATTSNWNRATVDLFFAAVRAANGTAPRPVGIPDKVMGRAQKITRLLSNGVGRIELRSPGREPVTATPASAVKVSVPTTTDRRWEYEDISEIEGLLEVASIHGPRTCTLYDLMTGRKTVCRVSADLMQAALEIMKSGKQRVTVYGTVRYDAQGYPTEIVAEAIERLPSFDDPPNLLDDVRINITDGLDSVGYIRSLRDAD